MKNDLAIAIPVKTLITIAVICIVIFLFVWSDSLKVKCGPEDKIELQGQLLGFTKKGSYWNVKLDNQTYVFNVFDKDYMKNMISYNVTISCCYRHDTSYRVAHYDMISCFINEVE